jgi:dTDP-glucose 4,6-dehydratase
VPPSIPEPDLDHILAHTGDLWESLRGQNLFVTGGTGFFGRWLVESFAFANTRLDLGAHMTILTRDPAAFALKAPALIRDPAIFLVAGDIRTLRYQAVIRHIPSSHSGRFDHVIHAATDSVGQTDPITTFNTIVNGTRAALDFAVATGATRFLFTSSGAVYGPQPSGLTHIPETYNGAPDCSQATSAYGEGKRAAELLCACYHVRHPALQPVIARCFAFVGPFLPIDAHFAIGNFIRDALRGGPIQIGGDGTPFRSYLHAADLAIWLWTLLLRAEPGSRYNVGSNTEVTILELAQTVAACFSPPTDIRVAGEPKPDSPPARYVPEVSLAGRDLGLTCRIPLAEAISRTISFHQAERAVSDPPV